ncbi:MAG TPA: hypothetical protein PLB36_02260 [Bacillota bacterium]|nr:hypothetical protein [Candidatus Fermentithermobacillaceae bacterium]HOB30206.1 hypothetical protein [Bacillota bacterium]HOK64185.1 hypothetical protein [Bacillota bacterium]HOL11694.1 hypothetical protein [Bacillota bacterium]HOQ02822.1 hypothetical protein [Bacillota bacterium]
MTKRDIALVFISILLALLTLSVKYVYLGGLGRPDLTLGLVCAVGWTCSWPVTLITAFAVGIIQDLLIGRYIGLSALSLLVAAMTMSGMRGPLNPELALSPVLAGALSALTSDFAAYLGLLLVKAAVEWGFFLRGILYFDVIWNVVAVLPFCLLISWISSQLAEVWPELPGEKEGRV